MTNKQLIVLDYIKRFIAEKNYSPTVREIMNGLGLKSPSSVHDHLKNLTMCGFISYKPQKSRTIDLLVPNEYVHDLYVDLQILDSEEIIDIPYYLIKDYVQDDLFVYKNDSEIYIVNKNDLNKELYLCKDKNNYIISGNKNNYIGNVVCKIKTY